METILTAVILALVLGLASYAIYRSKKKGQKCIGCPHSGGCSSCCQKDK